MGKNLMKALTLIVLLFITITVLVSCESKQEERKVDTSGSAETLPHEEAAEDNTDNTITVTVNNTTYTAELSDNETAKAFKSLLPLNTYMTELNGNEKYFELPKELPETDEYTGQIHTGDIMLYKNNTLVLFYKDFETTYNYTPIGKIVDPTGIEDVLGPENVAVEFN